MIVGHVSFTLNEGEVRPSSTGQEHTTKCVQVLNINEKQYIDILDGEAKPSMTLIRKYKLYTAGDGKIQFDGRKWAKLSTYNKLQIFYEDHAAMYGALYFTIHLLPK